MDQNGVSVGVLSDDDLCRALMRDDFDINDQVLICYKKFKNNCQ